jgi:hypothetical protein
MRAESTVEITSDALDVNVSAGNDVLVESGSDVRIAPDEDIVLQAGNAVVITSAAGNDITITSNDDVNITALGDVDISGTVRALRRGANIAFDIRPISRILLGSPTNVPASTGVSHTSIPVLRGIYNLKAMCFVDVPASTTTVDLLVTPSLGNVSANAANAVRGPAPSATAVFAAAGPTVNFPHPGALTGGAFVREIDGTIEFTQDCNVTFRWNNGGNAIEIQRGSFIRLMLIEAT